MTAAIAENVEYQGMPAVHLRAPNGAEATILLHGAHVVSWKTPNGDERLYMSDLSEFADGKPVRGGVPICFPQFSTRGPLPGHGFARLFSWELIDARTGDDYAMAVLRLVDNASTREMWPHAFIAEMTVSVAGDRLDMELEVENTGDASFSFTAALHTYLRMREVEEATLEGLRGQHYFNNVSKEDNILETGVVVAISEETDRVYYDTKNPLLLREPHRSLGINAENMPETVVWNPWVERSTKIADLPDNGFRYMICVEAGAIQKPVELAPEASWWGRQTLVAM
ncbi:MAG: D-hexose-6-phosphate mutarotase [Rhodocyclaceae bacterium]